ncbi:unnamed protein product [Schistocephalus solidus]|uniref:MFS transporter n=1 Tax=Schistocephalus solidus TaxID=70667 RepID=A0A183TT52_SCHSO|nr:unnamed protein product [Schistocephalus solidus]
MGMLATYFTDSKERSQAFAFALTALALGVLVLQIIVFRPAIRPETEKGASIFRLLMDPYILLGAGNCKIQIPFYIPIESLRETLEQIDNLSTIHVLMHTELSSRCMKCHY